MSLLIGIFTFVLILIAVFLVLLVLIQKPRADASLGASMGGGIAESTFGAETGNVLTKLTIRCSVAFFLISFLLYLGHVYLRAHAGDTGGRMPTIGSPATLPEIPAGPAAPAAAPAAVPEAPAPVSSAPAEAPAAPAAATP